MGDIVSFVEKAQEAFDVKQQEEMQQYAVDRLTRRLESIQGARGRPVGEIDEDYSPMELEDRFGDEDARGYAMAAAAG